MEKKIIIEHETWLYKSVLYSDCTQSFFIQGKEYRTTNTDRYISLALEKLLLMQAEKDQIDYELAVGFRQAIRENQNHMLGFSHYKVKTVAQVKAFIERVWKREEEIRRKNS